MSLSLAIYLNSFFRISNYALIFIYTASLNENERIAILLFSSIQLITQFIDFGINAKIFKKLSEVNNTQKYKSYSKLYGGIYRALNFFSFFPVIIYSYFLLSSLVVTWFLAAIFVLLIFKAKYIDIRLKVENKQFELNVIELITNVVLITIISLAFSFNLLTYDFYALLMIIIIFFQLILKKRRLEVINYVESFKFFTNLKYAYLLTIKSTNYSMNSINIQMIPSLIFPMLVLAVPDHQKVFFLLTHRAFSIIDQFVWVPFYKNLPTWYALESVNHTINSNIKKTAYKVLIRMIFLIIIFSIFSNLMFFSSLLNYNFDKYIICVLSVYFVIKRLLSMNIQRYIINSNAKTHELLYLNTVIFVLGGLDVINFYVTIMLSSIFMLLSIRPWFNK